MNVRMRGYTLLEMLIVISCLAVVLGIVIGILHTLMRIDRAGRTDYSRGLATGRLARELRTDVHSAIALEGPDDKYKGSILLKLDAAKKQSVRYRVEGDRVYLAHEGGGNPGRTEAFDLGAPSAFSVETSNGETLVRLDIRPTRGGHSMPILRIEALLGRDHPGGRR